MPILCPLIFIKLLDVPITRLVVGCVRVKYLLDFCVLGACACSVCETKLSVSTMFLKGKKSGCYVLRCVRVVGVWACKGFKKEASVSALFWETKISVSAIFVRRISLFNTMFSR